MRIMIWVSSRGAPRRITSRGGRREAMVCSVGRTRGLAPFSKEYCSRSTAHTSPSRVPEGTVRSQRMKPGSTAGSSSPSRRQRAMAA